MARAKQSYNWSALECAYLGACDEDAQSHGRPRTVTRVIAYGPV